MAPERMSIDDRDAFSPASPPISPALESALASHYTIEHLLGRGGMATVLLARDVKYDRQVAIKVLHPELAQAVGASRFLREIRRTAQLNHPHIVPMLDSGEADGIPYFVMPHMDGGTLRRRLSNEGRLPMEDVVATGGVIAGALDYAHRHGLIHRDVKPENILFSEGEPYLADFGIARATERALDETATSRGVVPGTIAYMSPEQVTGDGEIDGRSDVFSLGCVLYEMLTGELPFTGPNAQATMTRRLIGPPLPIRELRPDVPEAVESTVMRALAIDRNDRFQTAAELRHALTGKSSSGARRVPLGLRSRWLSPRVIGSAAVALAAGVVVWMVGAQTGNGPAAIPADTTHIVAFPLTIEGDTSAVRLDDDLLHQALSRWRGIEVADRFAVADAMRQGAGRRGGDPYPVLAAALGAGRYIRGQVKSLGDSSIAYAVLYDVGRRTALYQASETRGDGRTEAAAAYGRLVDSLLLRGAMVDTTPGLPAVDAALPAIQAFAFAQKALEDWNLAAADSSFQAAAAFDPRYARAHLWLAQVRAWQGLPASRWATIADRAEAGAEFLSERERLLGRALVRLGKGDYEAACREYDALRRRNDRDFAAWFGLGQCRSSDKVVLADSTSPSGWRFRSSYHQAVASYTRAFEILPSVHRGYERGAFDRLRQLFLISMDFVLASGLTDSAVFLGRLGWSTEGDSLLLVPYPWQVVFAGSAEAIPPGFAQAAARQRAEFKRIAAGWSTAFPRSAGAKYAVAMSLELLGDRAALDTLRAARRLSIEPRGSLELAAAEARLLVKFGTPDDLVALAAARLLADSLLESLPPATVEEADMLAPLAAFIGRCTLAEQLARHAAPLTASSGMPAGLVSDAQGTLSRLAMHCTTEAPGRDLRSLVRSIGDAYVSSSAEERRRIEEMLLFRPVLLASELDSATLDRLGASTGNEILRAGRAHARRQPAEVRRALAAFAAQQARVLRLPSPDVAYAGATMLAASGDTARAIAWLDRALGGVRSYDPQILADHAHAAALVAAMILRADMAAATNRNSDARRWGAAVAALRSSADDPLAGETARMRRHAGLR